MSRAAKIRAKSDVGFDPRMGRVVNDNRPIAFPGHELSDLDGVSQEPPAETVLHYSRLSQIASFPLHPHAAAAVVREPPVMDALPERVRRRLPTGKKRTTITCLSSFLFHAALFAALTTASVTLPEDPVEDAGDTISVVMLGSSDTDALSVGEKQQQPDPTPEQVVAETVQSDTLQPTTDTIEVTPAETPPAAVAPTPVRPTDTPPEAVQPVEPTAAEPQPDIVQPTQQVQAVSPETTAAAEPEVITSTVPAEPTVAQPMATVIQPEETKPAEAQTTEIQPSEVQPTEQPVETARAAPEPPRQEVVTPVEKPEPPKRVAKPKDVPKKQPPKRVKPKSGSEGDSQQDLKRGSSEGTETAQSDHNSESAGNRQGAGSAAVANYPGKVQSRIRRSVRVPEEFRRMTAATTVRVRLTIGAGGNLTSVSLSRSSGVSELDNAVLEGVRRAAPFPPLPPEWGKPSWSFTQELQVTGD